MCRCAVTLFLHLFGVPVSIWRVPGRRRRDKYLNLKLANSLNPWTEQVMESSYDEDLNENIFFEELQKEYSSIFEKAINKGWILCVPRSGTFSRGSLLEDDFLGHILVPSEELPTSHFRTLTGKEVRLCNRVLTVDYDIAKPCTAHILFEETYYTNDSQKYRIWCIEHLLDQGAVTSHDTIPVLNNIRECVDFLWTETLNKQVLEELDAAIKEFEKSKEQLEDEPLQSLRDLVAALYAKSLGIVLRDSRLREKTAASRHFLHTIKVAVETYILHGLRNFLPKAVSAYTAFDDACLNKTIKNLHELQLRDLGVRPDLYGNAVRGKLELARLDGFATVLGKIGCLRRAVRFASQGETSVSSDDLLPVLIFSVIRAGLPTWNAQLAFMKQFRFSSNSEYETDEAGFLITSLEAAVEHVRSGVLIGSIYPEADDLDGVEQNLDQNETDENKDDQISVGYFFERVKHGNTSEVQRILSKKTPEKVTTNVKLCHPLCTCESCEKNLAKTTCVTLPTVHSRDDRGLTALHIAALYGQADMVDLLINHGSNVNEVDADGTTPLHCAGARGHLYTLLLLMHANADPTIFDAHGNTILHLAADNGHEACVKAVLFFAKHTKWPVDPNALNCNGDTPLHYSAKWGYTGIVDILLEHGAQPKIVNRRGQTPIALSHNTFISRLLKVAAGRHLQPIPRLVPHELIPTPSAEEEKQFEPTYPTERLRRVERLLSAISEGDLRLAYYYLGLEGPDKKPVEPIPTLCHPLCTCEKCSLIEEIPEEHQRKPALGINSCDGDGQTALHVASAVGHSEFVQLLLDAGAKINLKTKSKGRSPLHLACLNNQLVITKILLNSGECDVDVKDNSGDTPLHLASRTGDTRLVEVLIRHGANPRIRNSQGVTVIEEAEERVMVGIVKILRGNPSTPR